MDMKTVDFKKVLSISVSFVLSLMITVLFVACEPEDPDDDGYAVLTEEVVSSLFIV